jgi:hypothetical protein
MAANLERAAQFVREHGNAVEQARLAWLLTGEAAPPAAVDALLAGQRPDGGWAPFWAADYSGLDATCFRLSQADQLGIAPTDPRLAAAGRFLASRQQADGRWEEDPSVAEAAPPWARPGDEAAMLYLTANCGFWTAALGAELTPALRAATFLTGHLAPDGRLPGFLHTHWLAGGLWYAVGETDRAETVLATLRARLAEMPAGNLAWLITTLARAGAPGDHPLLRQAAAALAPLQQPDGRWTGDDPAQDVHVTLEAIRAVQLM